MDREKLSEKDRERVFRKLNRKLERKTREAAELRKKLDADHERLKNVWAALQSFAFVGAVIVGGIWTWYQKAEFDLQKHSSLSIDLKATQLTFPEKGNRFVRLDVLFTRTGNWSPEDTWVDLKNADLQIRKVTKVERDGTAWELKEPWKLKLEPGEKLEVSAGETKTETAIQELPEPGLYRALVSLPYYVKKKKDETNLGMAVLFIVK